MSIVPLTYYPEDVLLHLSEPVADFSSDLRELVNDMFDTMYAARGVGLAAPQIGISKRLFVMDCGQLSNRSDRLVVANPEVVWVGGEEEEEYEGCLSLPGYSYKLRRPTHVTLKGQDVNGEEFFYEVRGLEARCVLHETDHCDGILYFKRLTPLRRQDLLTKIKKRVKEGSWPIPNSVADPKKLCTS